MQMTFMSSIANLSSNTFRQEGDKLYQNEGKIMKDKTAKKKGKRKKNLKLFRIKLNLMKTKQSFFSGFCATFIAVRYVKANRIDCQVQ